MPADAPQSATVGIFSFSYSRRLIAIIVAAAAVAVVVRFFLVPKGFGEYGHYRGAAPAEAAARTPVFQGKLACGTCHPAELGAHEGDVHINVECEDCHGPGEAHVAARRANAPKEEGRIFRELEQSNCLACHRRLAARPKLFPTIDVAEHFALVGVKDPKTACQACHNPHQPLFLERPVAQARKHPLIHPCSDCHDDRAVEQRPMPAGHVVTFQCADCHAQIAADFKTRKHAFLDCRACHNFHKESEFSGVIFKNGNPRLCLMCHQAAPFKDDKVPKLESFEAHLADVAGDDDKGKRCADCHLNKRIHRLPERAAAARPP